MCWIGFDIGGTKILSAYSTKDGVLKGIRKHHTLTTSGDLLSYIEHIVQVYENEAGKCEAIGIGVAGAEKIDGTLWIPNLPAVTSLNLRKEMSAFTDASVLIENDAHAALRGEVWKGSLQKKENALILTVGTGIGGAVILDGRIIKGSHGVCGAAGWIFSGEAAFAHSDETTSGVALNEIAQANGYCNSMDLCEACKTGSPIACFLLDCWAERLGALIASLVSFLDVDFVSLSGGITAQYDLFREKMQSSVDQYISPLSRHAIVKKAELGELSGLYGAISYAMQASPKFFTSDSH